MPDPIAPSEANTDLESRKDADPQPERSQFWLGEITAAKKRDERWWKRAQKVVARFRDEREDDDDRGERRANILWSNTEILKAALFGGVDAPDVRRRFPKKGKDERASRTAAIVMERSLSYCQDAYDADSAIECAVEDMLLPGRGNVWVVYDAEIEPVEDDDEGDDAQAPPSPMRGLGDNGGPSIEQITEQSVRLEHVYWQDFLCSAGRKWVDVWWVSRRHLYSKDELKKFWPKHFDKIPLGATIEGSQDGNDKEDDTFKRAAVWEIWDKSKKRRIYVAEGYELVLQSDDDPYRLRPFFPCPEPLYGVKTTSSLQPIPEYTLYQDQATELDLITTRLYRLVDALKRRGVYDSSADGPEGQLSRLATAGDNEFLPYKGIAVLMEKGGLKNVFQTEDLAPIIAVVAQLYQQRAMLVQTIYEVTGISDVLRGASNPNETATAQKIKGQFGSLRLTKRQNEVHGFVRDAYRLKAEIMAEHFTREKLVEMTGIDMPLKAEIQQAQMLLQQVQRAQQAPAMPPPQPGQMPGMQSPMPLPGGVQLPPTPPPMPSPAAIKQAEMVAKQVAWEDVAAILRSDERRGYKIDIETAETAKIDDAEEKQARIEFVTSIQGFLQNTLPAALGMPEVMPLVRELTLFGTKAFKIGRTMEETIEDVFDKLEQAAVQRAQQGPPPDPKAEAEAAKAKAIVENAQAKTEAIKTKTMADVQIAQMKAQADGQSAQVDNAAKGREIQNSERQAELDAFKTEQEIQQSRRSAQLSDLERIQKMVQPQERSVQ